MKIFIERYSGTYARPHLMVKRGLAQIPDVKIVHNHEESDLIFAINNSSSPLDLDMVNRNKEKVVFIDYQDNANHLFGRNYKAYFKRSVVSPFIENVGRTNLYANDNYVKPIWYC